MEHQRSDDAAVVSSIPPLEADIAFSGQPPSPPWPDLDDLDVLDFDIQGLSSPPPANATSSAGSGSVSSGGSHKKLSHNAYERDRRKQLNDLYSSLRSLLPDADHAKKLSIPTTVCQVLEYIPKLQKQVDNLKKKKQELTRGKCKAGVLRMSENRTPIVSATCLNYYEIMVQVSLLSNMAAALPLSMCIKVLENEGLDLISSSAFSTFGNKTFYSIHLQRRQGTINKECRPALFCDKLEKAVKQKA